ncbi:MAG: hypothetical protein AB8H86_10960 [Polyangiales bacterium]
MPLWTWIFADGERLSRHCLDDAMGVNVEGVDAPAGELQGCGDALPLTHLTYDPKSALRRH